MKKIITITGAAILTAAMTGCSFSVGMDANNSTANTPAANAPAKNANTAANANSANKTGNAKPALQSEKRPEGEAKSAKKTAVPANWVYIYDEAKGYGFSMPEGSTGETETIEGIDIFGATTPAPSEVDVIVLAYKDAKRT